MSIDFSSEVEPKENSGVSGGKVWGIENTISGKATAANIFAAISIPITYFAIVWTGLISDFPFWVIVVIGLMCITASILFFRPSPHRNSSIKDWLVKWVPPAIISATMAGALIAGPQIRAEHIASVNHELTQEYGYSQVLKNRYQEGVSIVVLEDGTEKKVGLMFYHGYAIYYENEEQLLEKMHKVDAGKYSEDFKK